ncbi:MAG: heavy-metal-associated domain-containing protein [Desulfomonile tiedjei]|nr:heavy-metal-associated domain-containing protein [Desulfomonile tiedjei]
MATEKEMKKIDMATLDTASRNVSLGKLRRAGMAVALVLVLAGGGYAAYRMVTGDVVASRFTVNNMNCPACVITVKEVTAKLPGVVEADVSLAAQDVTVKYREKQTGPDQIKDAIAKAGYPIKLDGIFKSGETGGADGVVATVNGKPLFAKDIKVPLAADKNETKDKDPASAFFSVVGKEILLQAADAKTVVIQPHEIETEVQTIFKGQGVSKDEFAAWMTTTYSSPEKYYQVVGQRLGIRKLMDENVLEGVKDPKAKSQKAVEWMTERFKEADVKVVDLAFREKLHAGAGQIEWKSFWPRMIGQATELKTLVAQ